MKGQPLHRRMLFALHGLKLALLRERSFRTHLAVSVIVVTLLLLMRPSAVWSAILILTIGLVLATELLNSALEALIDHLHPEEHPAVGAAKDIAAGAVLVASIAACVIGVIFFIDWLNG